MNRFASMLKKSKPAEAEAPKKDKKGQPGHFVDQLIRRIKSKGTPVCVGIDPVVKRFPEQLRNTATPVEAIEKFCSLVLDVVGPHVPAVKFQSACFERYFTHGQACLHRLMDKARSMNLTVILDGKRGDIGSNALHYAYGCLANRNQIHGPDALTINSYFGKDAIKPFLEVAAKQGKGLFAVVRSSNRDGDAIQGLTLEDGRTVAEAVAQVVAEIGDAPEYIGESGYSLLGASVGITRDYSEPQLRRVMPKQFLLISGFDAQEKSENAADSVRAYFQDQGTGALVTACRSIIYNFDESKNRDWEVSVERAVQEYKLKVAKTLKG